MAPIKSLIQPLFLKLIDLFASDIRDFETGEKIGRALLVPWRGQILVIGGQDALLIPKFLPQERLTYWKQELGFTTHRAVDFTNEKPGS